MSKYNFYTDGGCQPPIGPAGWGVCVIVEDQKAISYHELFGSIPEGTNNIAELMGAIKAVEYAIELDLPKLTIHTDSTYVLNGITKWHIAWAKAGWVKPDGTVTPNRDVWKRLIAIVATYKRPIKWLKVKAHSGVEGNERADALATRGKTLAFTGVEEEHRTVPDANAPKKAKAPKAKYNRLISNARLYFDSKGEKRLNAAGQHVYFTGFHGKEESFVARRMYDAIHSVVFLNSPEPVLDKVIARHQTGAVDRLPLLAVGRLDAINNAAIYNSLLEPKTYTMIEKPSVPGVCHIDGSVLSYDHMPPIHGFVHLDDMKALELTLSEYIKGSKGIVVTDITDVLYDVTLKGKGKQEHEVWKMKPELGTTVSSFTCKVSTPKSGMQELLISMGHIAPTRNTLSAVASDGPQVKVITWSEGTRAYRYAVIIETKLGIAIWTSMHANIKFTK